MLEKAWENNTYGGYGTVIHRVEHDSSRSDFSLDVDYEKSRDFLAKSLVRAPQEICDEFRMLMSHFSSGLYRWQFKRCREGGPSGACQVCPKPEPPRTPVERFYEKFGGDFPSPTPFWAAFPAKPAESDAAKGPVEVLNTASRMGPGSKSGFHYRVFLDFLNQNIPSHRIFPDQHYDGPTGRHACTLCNPEVCHRSAAALLRHNKMLHT